MKQKIFLIGLIVVIMMFASLVEADAAFKVYVNNGTSDGDGSPETIMGVENSVGDVGWEKYWQVDKNVTGEAVLFNWSNSNMSVQNINYTWSPLNESATILNLTDDELSSSISVGFNTDFYGNTYNSVRISSNGFVTFTDTSHGCCAGQDLPDASAPNNLLVGWWEDLRSAFDGGNGTIKYQSLVDDSGKKWFVIEYDGVTHYPSINPVSFQIHIGEKNGTCCNPC